MAGTLGFSPAAQAQTGKKRKAPEPLLLMRLEINAAAKQGSWQLGWAAYQAGREQGLKATPDMYNTLLFLCSGGDDWEARCPGPGEAAPPASQPTADLLRVGEQLLADMRAAGTAATPTEMRCVHTRGEGGRGGGGGRKPGRGERETSPREQTWRGTPAPRRCAPARLVSSLLPRAHPSTPTAVSPRSRGWRRPRGMACVLWNWQRSSCRRASSASSAPSAQPWWPFQGRSRCVAGARIRVLAAWGGWRVGSWGSRALHRAGAGGGGSGVGGGPPRMRARRRQEPAACLPFLMHGLARLAPDAGE